MITKLDCLPCFQQQALRAARAAGADEETQRLVLRRVIEALLTLDWSLTPMHLARPVYRIVRDITGVDDPFEELKRASNTSVLAFYESARQQVEGSPDPVKTAARFAIAGNIMDYGALDEFDLSATLDQLGELAVDDADRLETALETARSLLYFADNAGELVFDRLLIETIQQRKPLPVTLVVKSGPLINDATRTDAEHVKLLQVPGLRLLEVDNGDGLAPDYASEEIRAWIAEHDVVIAKGQGNYEALSEYPGIYYLLMIKCPAVARDTGIPQGSIVLQYR